MTQDELSLLIYPDLMNQGRWANRDFFTPYGPGTFWPLAAAFRLAGGPAVGVERAVGATYHVLVALAIWALVSNRGRWIAVAAGSLSGVLAGGLMLVAYGWLAALASVLWSMAAGQSRRWVLAGGLGAVACTVRPEFIVVVTVLALIQVDTRRFARRFGLGFLVGALPLIGHLLVVRWSLPANVFVDRVGVDARFPISGRPVGLQVALVLLVISVAVIVVAAVRHRRRSDAAWASLALMLLPQALQRFDQWHVLFVAIAVVPLAASVVLERFVRLAPRSAVPWAPRVLVGTCCAVVVFGGVLAGLSPRGSPVKVGDRELLTRSDSSSALIREAAFAVDRTLPADQAVLAGVTDNRRVGIAPSYFYFLLPHRVPDAYFLELAPGITEERGSGLVKDFRGSQALILTNFPRAQSQALYPYLGKGSTTVNRYVRRHFCEVRSVAGFEIFQRC